MNLPSLYLFLRPSICRACPPPPPTIVATPQSIVQNGQPLNDLTGRFPIPSFNWNEYILITVHLGYIHYLPLQSRTAASYNSTFSQNLCLLQVQVFSRHSSYPNQHRTNRAERAFRTGKNPFLSVLSAAHIYFPPNR
jgi:hypothetical protein